MPYLSMAVEAGNKEIKLSKHLKYLGYMATIRFESADKIFVGRVINTNDVISFESESAPELEAEFHKAIDDYLKYCDEKGTTPEKPFNGNFMVRSDADLHKELFELAAESEVPMNELAVQVLQSYVDSKKNRVS